MRVYMYENLNLTNEILQYHNNQCCIKSSRFCVAKAYVRKGETSRAIVQINQCHDLHCMDVHPLLMCINGDSWTG